MLRQKGFWLIVKTVLLKIYGVLIRVRVVGREYICQPMYKGFIVAANHLTGADSIVIQIALKTRIFYLAWKRWFYSRFVGFWMKNLCDTMPVENRVDASNVATLRRSIELLKNGAAIGVFPEGEMNRTGKITHLHNGTAWLAVRAGVPVLPVYIAGLKNGPEPYSKPWLNEAWEGFFSVVENIFNRHIVVAVGKPIYPEAKPWATDVELKREINRINQELLCQFQLLARTFNRVVSVDIDHRRN